MLSVSQRVSVALSCIALWALLVYPSMPMLPKVVLLAVVALLACIEKLVSLMNTLAVERDWVRLPGLGLER